jgi:TolB-like protein
MHRLVARSLSLVVALHLGLASAQPASATRVVVLEFHGVGVPADQLRSLTDDARAGAVLGTKGRDASVVSAETVWAERKGHEDECDVELGRAVGADTVVSGTVAVIDAQWRVSLRLHDSKSGALVATRSALAATPGLLRKQVSQAVNALVLSGLDARAVPADAGRARRLVVFELPGSLALPPVKQAMTDEVRAGALRSAQGLFVMSPDSMEALLKDLGAPTTVEEPTEIETARTVGADYWVSGALARAGAQLVLSLTLYESTGGKALATHKVTGAKALALIAQLEQAGRQLVDDALAPKR